MSTIEQRVDARLARIENMLTVVMQQSEPKDLWLPPREFRAKALREIGVDISDAQLVTLREKGYARSVDGKQSYQYNYNAYIKQYQ